MYFIDIFFRWYAGILFAAMIVIWCWIFFYKIKCRKVQSCTKRDCKYWEYCTHNEEERNKADMEACMELLQNGEFSSDVKEEKAGKRK